MNIFTTKGDFNTPEIENFEKNYKQYGPLFLEKSAHMKVAIASMPRTGFSLTRRYFETITHTVMGRSGDLSMLNCIVNVLFGLKGNGHTGEDILFFNTKHPLQIQGQKEADASKMIVIVRNPIDVIVSHCHMVLSGT
mmetsp:Transcript_38493/g.28327  ORF Transcript_38493/g.28327 Transcript_38493/m.28327 type:complete len:137 (+) Transcript_38493:395-805(+)|eukprot:CAMPEP_0202957192 /NCGR_PEP_ID=MMETSP1396-20130829/1625_1 /ASSEMBLY_ACC=CAM_ASM_000872 /TAXON_ID= /ORGANISM="Pseudokeronopsis sp., Strain Brazil" /LENGTH=136 /DNA_ID=CAMNT_0049674555 /DNA_START=416 /DNA_END=826 /DNA_ORIENTATION=+